MSTEIKYKNNFGKEITFNQMQQSQVYTKHYNIDGKVKIVERIEEGVLESVNYYLDSNETINFILPNYSNVKIVVFVKTEVLVNCIKEDNYIYENGFLTGRSIEIFKYGFRICFRSLDLQEQPIRTTKYFYENGEEKYDFEYKNDGTCFMIYKNNEFGEDILAANIGQPGVSFSWDEVGDYYKNADPIIPPLVRASRSYP